MMVLTQVCTLVADDKDGDDEGPSSASFFLQVPLVAILISCDADDDTHFKLFRTLNEQSNSNSNSNHQSSKLEYNRDVVA